MSGIVLLPVTFSVCITTKQTHDDIAKGCCQLTCFLWSLSPDFSGLLVSGNLTQEVSPWIFCTRKIKKKNDKKNIFLVFFSIENHSNEFCYSKESIVKTGQQIPVMFSQHVSFCPRAQCVSSKIINY